MTEKNIPAWTIENFLEARGNQLYIDGVRAADLADEHGTPLFVFSESRIRGNIERLMKAQASISCRLKICYAAKANSNMAILRTVKESNCDLEVNSGGELWKALEIGFAPEQIIFNGTSKEIWEIENAVNAGIYAIQVDSSFELSLIEATARRLNKCANVSLRLVPEIETNTHSGLQTALLTSKFGMMPAEALAAFREYQNSDFLNLCGVHLHIGSQNPDSAPYADALQTLFENLLEIYNKTGIKLSHLNLGGGFPVNYLRDASQAADFPEAQKQLFAADFEPADAIARAWQTIENSAQTSGAANLLDNLTLLLEPGRSVIADAGVCLTTVRNVKERPLGNSKFKIQNSKSEPETKIPDLFEHQLSVINYPLSIDSWLLTDAGFNILLSMETYKWYYQLVHAGRAAERHDFAYKVAGPLCDGGDVYFDIEGEKRLPEYRLLPRNIEPDDLLALLNCGAYSIAQMFQYNGRFLPAVVLIRTNGAVELIRRRDDFKSLVSEDVW